MENEEKIKLKEEKKKEKEKKKLERDERKKQKLPKEISQDLLKGIVRNLVKAGLLMLYFFTLNIAITTMNEDRLLNDLKVFSALFLILGLYLFERAYSKDDGKKAISGIEAIVLCAHTLSIMHVVTKFEYDFRLYLLTSSYIFSIYYVLKSIIMYTRDRREYLNNLSDIHEILQDEPVKKEAVKRRKTNDTQKEELEPIEEKEEKQNKNNQKTKTISKSEKDIKEKTKKEPAKAKKEPVKSKKSTSAKTESTKTKKTTEKEKDESKKTTTKKTTTKTTTKGTSKTTTKKATSKTTAKKEPEKTVEKPTKKKPESDTNKKVEVE